MLWRANFSACKPVSGRGVADEETFLSCPRKPEECDAFQADAVNKAPWKRCWLANLDESWPSFLRAIARAENRRAGFNRPRARAFGRCLRREAPPNAWRVKVAANPAMCFAFAEGPNYDLKP